MTGTHRTHASESSVAACQVEAILSIDNRGQIVIPKEVRAKADIRDGDKLALVSWMDHDKVCCLSLIRTDNLSSNVTSIVRSLMRDNGD